MPSRRRIAIRKILSIGLNAISSICGHIAAWEFAFFRGASWNRSQARLRDRSKSSRCLSSTTSPACARSTRALLQAIGIKTIYEANDGRGGLEAICTRAPDIVILDWEMPSPNGPEFMRAVRSPDSFPLPDVPIIMLTGHSERRA